MRYRGQMMIEKFAGKVIHPVAVVPGGFSKPQLGHAPLGRSGAAQLPQNLKPSGFSKEQAGQFTRAFYREAGPEGEEPPEAASEQGPGRRRESTGIEFSKVQLHNTHRCGTSSATSKGSFEGP